MDSDSDKENYFSLYMKKKKSESQKKGNFRSNKRLKNKCASSQKLKDGTNNKNSMKLLLESPEKKHKSKNAFSFVKSNLLNIKDNKNKNKHSTKNKNMTTEKQKMKNEKFNKSTNDIKKYAISSPKNNYEFNENKKNDNQKIEKIQNRIFNLMDIINTFENDFIKSKKPLQIKQQFDKIKYKITPIPLKLNLEKNINKAYKNNITDSTNYFNNDYQNISKTERINYPQKEISENSKNKIAYVYSKLFDDFKNINFNLDNKNIIHTKRINGMRQHSAMNQRISSDKNMAIIILNKQKNNSNNINKNSINNNSAFMKLISSELKKMNSNFAKNKSKSLVNKMNINSNSSSNKTLYKNENIDEKKQKQNIFKRRINYSNFINQKMKQNIIIHRNQGNYLKQNMANKSKNNNKSNGCNTCFDLNHNDNYVKNLLNKNGKSKSIDRSNLNNVNNINDINI
jgi:hypothetical protein